MGGTLVLALEQPSKSAAWRANTFQLSEPKELTSEHEQPFWPQPPTKFRTVSAMTFTATHEMPISRAFSMNASSWQQRHNLELRR